MELQSISTETKEDKDGEEYDYDSPWSFSSDEEEDEEKVEAVGVKERYSACKIWTNLYGLALGTFCIVYSLLLATELGSFTFCFCLWLESFRQCSKQRRTCCLSLLILVGMVLKLTGGFLVFSLSPLFIFLERVSPLVLFL